MLISQTGIFSKAGLTLIELVVVIFILSMFIAISIPSFKGLEQGKTKTEAKRVASIIRYLNDTAMSRKEELYLNIDFEDRAISYKTEEGEKTERLEYLDSVFLETKGKIKEGEIKIFFTPLNTGEFMRFYFSKVPSEQYIIVEFNPLSGRIRIDEIKEGQTKGLQSTN